jgi:hypothetical protein
MTFTAGRPLLVPRKPAETAELLRTGLDFALKPRPRPQSRRRSAACRRRAPGGPAKAGTSLKVRPFPHTCDRRFRELARRSTFFRLLPPS